MNTTRQGLCIVSLIQRSGGLLRAFLTGFNALSLAKQYFLSGGAVALLAMLVIGLLVTDQIAQSVTRNAGATTALYVDSIIAPILPDMTKAVQLDESIERALDEVLSQGALGRRLVSFRLWREDGTILYSNDKQLMNRVVPPGQNRLRAFTGELVAKFDEVDDPESSREREIGEPLLEIYNPILQPWSGQVVAVVEFYERASDLEASLAIARLKTWLIVFAVVAGFFMALSAIVVRGSRIIDRQLRENIELTGRVRKAAQRTASLNERFLRRVGADLHDGPAQLIAYAALRIDSELILDGTGLPCEREKEISTIKRSLDDAIQDIRDICQGLVLPEIENFSIRKVLGRVVESYVSRTGAHVDLLVEGPPQQIPVPAKICVYRFVQEALTNGWRHADGKGQSVIADIDEGTLVIKVSDAGPGFAMQNIQPGRLGLSGLQERVESLGGRFHISSSSKGTVVTMTLNVEIMELS